MSSILSLCLAVPNIYDEEKKSLVRIKDVKDNLFCDYDNLSVRGAKCSENNEYKLLFTHYPQCDVNDLCIWEWTPFEKKAAIKKFKSFYELVSSTKFRGLNSEEIVFELKKGVDISGYHGQSALLLIDELPEYYISIELNTQDFKTNKGITKINKNTRTLNIYKIPRENFFSTIAVEVIDRSGNVLPHKIIYNELKLRKADLILDILSFSEKLSLYINKQTMFLEITKLERRKMKHYFDEMFSNYDEIKTFFRDNNFSDDKFEENIDQVELIIKEMISDETMSDSLVNAVIKGSSDLTEQMRKKIEIEFIDMNEEKISAIEKKIVERESEIEILEDNIKSKQTMLKKLEKNKKDVENKTRIIEEFNKTIESVAEEKIVKTKANLSNFVTDLSILKALDRTESKVDNNSKVPLNIQYNCSENNCELLYKFDELLYSLSNNLKIAQIDKNLTVSLSAYILTTLCQKTKIMLVGKNSNNILQAVSASINAEKADIITIQSPNITYDEILEAISSCDSKIVGISNLVHLNENLTYQISNEKMSKELIFINEIPENIQFCNKSIFNYFNCVFSDNLSSAMPSNEMNFDFFDSSQIELKKKIDKYVFKENFDKLKKLKNISIYSKLHCNFKTELASIIEDSIESNGIFPWLLFEAIPLKKLESDDYSQMFDNLDLTSKEEHIIESVIW